MNISNTLRRWLDSGTRPSSQRETSSLLDESRSIIASQLQTTMQHIQNLSNVEIDNILAGGKGNTLDRMHKLHLAKEEPASRPAVINRKSKAAASRPAAKQDRIADLCAYITKPKKPLSLSAAKNTQPAQKVANAPAQGNKFKGANYAILHQAATHRSSAPSEKAAARAQLVAAHGVTITESGITSHSTRGGRAMKQSISNQKTKSKI